MKTAIKLIGSICLNEYHHSCNILDLSGPKHKDIRQIIYSDLTGIKQPKSKSGVSNIEKWIFNYFKPAGDCGAARNKNLYTLISNYLIDEENGK